MTIVESRVEELRLICLNTYQVGRLRIEEDYNNEVKELAGGNSDRQILELVQNGADAIVEGHELPGVLRQEARIEVTLSGRYLYAANPRKIQQIPHCHMQRNDIQNVW